MKPDKFVEITKGLKHNQRIRVKVRGHLGEHVIEGRFRQDETTANTLAIKDADKHVARVVCVRVISIEEVS